MTPKEARKKFCPMSMSVPDDRDIRYCKAYDCAVWEVDRTQETVFKEVQPEGEGWEKVALHKETDSQIYSYSWTRTLPLEDQPGQCGLITKYLE